MDFDFAQKYAGYPTSKLLLILADAHKYQPEAVAIAQQILATRTITDADRQALLQDETPKPDATRQWLHQPGDNPASPRQPFTGESIFEETDEDTQGHIKQLRLWRRLIAAALAIPALVYLFTVLYLFAELPGMRSGSRLSIVYGINAFVSLLVVVAGILGIALLLLKKRLGWLLSTGFNSYALAAMLSNVVLASVLHNGGMRVYVGAILAAIVGASMYLLWQPLLRNSHSVTKRVGYTIVAFAVLLSLIMAMYNTIPALTGQL